MKLKSNKKRKLSDLESPHAQYKKMADEAITLKIFDIIQQNPRTSQQKIALKTGFAAGLVHSFMRRVIGKGWVRAKKVNAKRWLYFMTPDGFMEKSKLTMNYLSRTMQTYQVAQQAAYEQLEKCVEMGFRNVVVGGENELAEITVLNVKALNDFSITGIVSDTGVGNIICGVEIFPLESIKDLDFDIVISCKPNLIERLNKYNLGKRPIINLIDKFSL